MIIGLPKELKNNEFRVGMLPWMVKELTLLGHTVLVEKDAGLGAGADNQEYLEAGAELKDSNIDIWDEAELIVKVKEPISEEYSLIKKDQIIFTYLHLAPNKELTKVLLDSGSTALAYETLSVNGQLPLLTPMSIIAGKLASSVGAELLKKPFGGKGKLIGGLPGVKPAKVLILGAGAVGFAAAEVAYGMGASVTVLDIDTIKLTNIYNHFHGHVEPLLSNPVNLKSEIKETDILIGGVLIPGEKAPKLVSRELISTMGKGSILVDVAIDQGGCIEGSLPTTHENPTINYDDKIIYSVANMPGSVPITSTAALTNATYRYIKALASLGLAESIKALPEIESAINIDKGEIKNFAVAKAYFAN